MHTLRGVYAHRVLEKYHSQFRFEEIPEYDPDKKAPQPIASTTGDVPKIGIIGAGIAGLYTALILDWLNRDGPQFSYEILEANPDRIGGRLYTHHFKTKNPGTYDYYDVGAMRFPSIPWMKPVHDLFDYLELNKLGLIIPYIMSDKAGNNISYFNGQVLSARQIEAQINAGQYDVFNTGLSLEESPETIFKSVFGPFKKKLSSEDPAVWKAGLEELFEYDDWSTRTFMRFRPDRMMDISPGRLPQEIISYLETLDTSTGNYDQAFAESVLDSVDFDTPGTTWVCIKGGAEVIADKARKMVKEKQNVHLGKQVSAIAPRISKDGKDVTGVYLTIHGEENDRVYDHVISTMSLSCLSVVDMSKCKLDWKTRWPIRQLHYDASVKVAIRFSERWWEDSKLVAPQIGGVSSTDRPTRVVVYPSYGIPKEPGTKEGSETKKEYGTTMIVSYTWAQDALRLGSGVNESTLSQELLDVILKDLTDMHGIKDDKLLRQLMIDHHAWDWTHDKFTMGPFALFSPAQFTHLYPEVTKPAFGRLHFAGEATSVHHAWVVGALYSAFRCVVEVLAAHNRKDLIKKLQAKDSPFASAGVEDDEHELSVELIGKQVALGVYEGKKLAELIPK
ncbi:unnamed protein product [Rhizoctonia solani]|uniref:Amine oxidase domain-containing protein n=1 Tax=Rhizoctonia solani TaxID=456999 RepID=A0A8H2X8L3_9AGAM|nr:unnamed protein product [Rhizoctonia solani]